MRQRYISGQLSAYPDLLNRYLVTMIQMAVYRAPPFLLSATRPDVVMDACSKKRRAPAIDDDTQAKMKRCRFSFSEQILWTEPLRGTIPLTAKEIADNLAIGGLRNTAESVGRIHMVKQFGTRLGDALQKMMNANTAEHVRILGEYCL